MKLPLDLRDQQLAKFKPPRAGPKVGANWLEHYFIRPVDAGDWYEIGGGN